MTDTIQVPICEKCGNLMEVRSEGSTQGLFCPNCGWSVVTTNIQEIKRDNISYEVIITTGDYQNEHHIKAVAQVAGVNFLTARKLLEAQSSFMVYKGIATEVIEVQSILKVAGLVYEIYPQFPWVGD